MIKLYEQCAHVDMIKKLTKSTWPRDKTIWTGVGKFYKKMKAKELNKWRSKWTDYSQMPAWEVIQDRRRNRITPQILSIQRTCDQNESNMLLINRS